MLPPLVMIFVIASINVKWNSGLVGCGGVEKKCVFVHLVWGYTLNAFVQIVKTHDQHQFVCQLVYSRWSNLRHDTGELQKFQNEIRYGEWKEWKKKSTIMMS